MCENKLSGRTAAGAGSRRNGTPSCAQSSPRRSTVSIGISSCASTALAPRITQMCSSTSDGVRVAFAPGEACRRVVRASHTGPDRRRSWWFLATTNRGRALSRVDCGSDSGRTRRDRRVQSVVVTSPCSARRRRRGAIRSIWEHRPNCWSNWRTASAAAILDHEISDRIASVLVPIRVAERRDRSACPGDPKPSFARGGSED